MTDEYNDIIDMPRPVSHLHAPMPLKDRAAQFSPFAALTGYDEVIRENARETQEKRIADEQRKSEIDKCLSALKRSEKYTPAVRVTFFEADAKKDGGEYVTVNANLRRVDDYSGKLLLCGGTEIDISDIWDIYSEVCDAEI